MKEFKLIWRLHSLSPTAMKAMSFLEEGTMRGWKQQFKGNWKWEKEKGENLKETKKMKTRIETPQGAN